MSQYTCRIYRNSGFNAVNIPDSPALLDTLGNYVDCYALDLNQERFLPIVKIRGDWASVKDTDYCKVGDFFYFVDDVQMIAGDVAQLTLTPDFITSAGGPGALEILDGVTDRVHVTDDSFGLYGADDPYMSPSLDMDIVSATEDFSSTGFYTFVETTLDLAMMGAWANLDNVPALTCKDTNVTLADGTNPYVVVPNVEYLAGETNYSVQIAGVNKGLTSLYGQGCYCLGDSSDAGTQALKKGIALARALGVDESISGIFSIPKRLINSATPGTFQSGMQGITESFTMPVPFRYGSANNNRVWYGSYSPYTLTSAGGSSITANAEEIYNGSTNPQVVCVSDPRRSGKPYFRFNPLNGINIQSNAMDFFRGSVAGKEWNNVPLVMTEKSGNLLDRINYDNSRMRADLDYAHNETNKEAFDAVNKLNAWTAGIAGGISGTGSGINFGSAISAGVAEYQNNLRYSQYQDKYNMQKAIDEQQLKISQNVNVPDVKFPVSPDLFAEITGNGCMVSRAVYKSADISRIDKILTAYGYKYAKVLEASDFTNRTYFNYVSGSITVGNLPRWWADGISAQIGTGVRVWHVKPNHSYYSSNPVRS